MKKSWINSENRSFFKKFLREVWRDPNCKQFFKKIPPSVLPVLPYE
jgi:hypothetical protein